jgi:hypothetical protein
MLTGHFAVAALLRHYLKTKPLPTLGGSMAPDLLDKGLHLGRATNSSRTYGHTLLGATLSTALVGLIWGKTAAQSWLIGYLGHLLCDADGFVPWLYPWRSYRFHPSLRQAREGWLTQFLRPSPLELILHFWTAVILLKNWLNLKN